MKRYITKALALALAMAATSTLFAQDASTSKKDWSKNVPEAGSVSVGLEFNPVAAAKGGSASALSSVGSFIYRDQVDTCLNYPSQMFFLAQRPMVSIAVKYKITKSMTFKGSVGFSGGYTAYREYVKDDLAVALNPLSEKKVWDEMDLSYAGGNITAGMEWNAGKGSLKFVGGFGLMYAFGGGSAKMKYGNLITSANQKPSCMDKIEDHNNFDPSAVVQMDYARPVKQYNVGVNQGIGLYAQLGIEWFFIPRVSLGATLDITPLMVAWQPQTYVQYEGYNKFSGAVEKYNQLISPGSMYLLYGTENLGCTLSLNYYF